MSIGKRIRDTRKSRKLTQAKLASKVQKSPQVISNWERGYTTPDSMDIAELSKVLDVSADFLLGDNKNKLSNNIDSSNDENLFYFNLEGLSEKDKKEIEEYIALLRLRAKQFNEDPKKND